MYLYARVEQRLVFQSGTQVDIEPCFHTSRRSSLNIVNVAEMAVFRTVSPLYGPILCRSRWLMIDVKKAINRTVDVVRHRLILHHGRYCFGPAGSGREGHLTKVRAEI